MCGKPVVVIPGQKYGRLTVIREFGKHRRPDGRSVSRVLCQCECGANTAVVMSHLRSGHTTSCGCHRQEVGVINGRLTATHRCTGTPTFKSWDAMRQRCNNPKDRQYRHYGGRGITVCQRWQKSFEHFLTDMGERPLGHSIDRIDNGENYDPNNCRWATVTQQARNKRNNVMLTYMGETCCIGEWAQRTGIGNGVLSQRIKRGWSAEDALTTPVRGARI